MSDSKKASTPESSGCCTPAPTPQASCCGPSPSVNTVPEDENAVREQVSEAYAAALKQAQEQDGGGCCSNAVPVGVAAQTAGYTDEERAAFEGAAQSSFGCGNPLAFEGVEPRQIVLDLGSGAGFDLLIAARRSAPEAA